MSATAGPDLAHVRVDLGDDHLTVTTDGSPSSFHHVWLRDNCGCPECRIVQSGERALFTATIPDDIAPTRADLVEGSVDQTLRLAWNDGHTTTYSLAWLLDHDYSSAPPEPGPVLWDATLAEVP